MGNGGTGKDGTGRGSGESDQPVDLAALRQQLDALDTQLLELVAQRQAIVATIGRTKHRQGRHLRDFQRERQVLNQARQRGAALGLNPELSSGLMGLLIDHSLRSQERGGLSRVAAGQGRSALVIGGLGRMGRWLADFLAIQGYAVQVADPAFDTQDDTIRCAYPVDDDWRPHVAAADIVVVATPMAVSIAILEELAQRLPAALVFDVASLKAPLLPALHRLAQHGVRVASLHPLFGPGVHMLSGRHVALIDVGCPAATAEAGALFANTMAEVVTLSGEQHDRLMAYVLSFSHLLNIAFAQVLNASGEEALRLRHVSSTSFEEQLNVARRIAAENPQVYYEIQSLNPHAGEIRHQLQAVLQHIDQAIQNQDQDAFTAIMRENHAFLERMARAPSAGNAGK